MTVDLAGYVAAVAVGDNELAAAIGERFTAAGARARRIVVPKESGSDPARGFQQIVADLAAETGRLDIWVQDDHTDMPGPVSGVDARAWQNALARGIGGTVAGVQAAGKVMQSQDNGAIVLLTSVDGLLASAGRSVACCGAAMVMMLTKVLAVEWAAHGVRVNAVASTTWLPPPLGPKGLELTAAGISATRIPLGRPATRAEVAEAAYYLASPRASFVTGEVLRVDGGWAGYHLF